VSGIELVVVDDPAAEVARRLAQAEGDVALAGGSTPRRAYELAAELRDDWSTVSFWWSDERCVPPEDPRSNYRMARDALLRRVAAREHRIRGELGGEEAARLYEGELARRPLDLCLLGVGADGHTASLFPNAPSVEERERWVVRADAGLEPFVERVTLTLPGIAAAREVLFLAAGADKADAVDRAFARSPDAGTPASLARGARTTVVLDPDAASRLPR
jgi:6-phosphogluconolactonase